MADIHIYSAEGCPFAQRTRMALIEKAVEFELTEIDLGNKPSWFSELSPYGKVPLLTHNDGKIYESFVINQYLDEVFPDPAMMPTDPMVRAQARIWMDYCETRYIPSIFGIRATKDDTEKLNDALAKIEEVMLYIETEGLRKLSDGPFWLGEKISLLDLHYSPFFERFPVYEEMFGARIPKECNRLLQWLDAIKCRESYKLTARTPEIHIERYKKRFKEAA